MQIFDFIASPVSILTTNYNEKLNGCTVAWVMQCSFSPGMVAVALAEERYTYELIKQSKKFCLNFLEKGQKDIAKKFGFTSGRNKNKFEKIEHTLTVNKMPKLKNIKAYIECELEEEKKAGDHIILIGKVIDFFNDESKEALVFKGSDFGF